MNLSILDDYNYFQDTIYQPKFANFCMSQLVNKLLSQTDKKYNTIVYLRSVDDIFEISKSHLHIRIFIERWEINSILNFTYEVLKINSINFLDVKWTYHLMEASPQSCIQK